MKNDNQSCWVGMMYGSVIAFLLTGIFASVSASPWPERPGLDSAAVDNWWEIEHTGDQAWLNRLKVPRDEVVAFALYTHHRGVLKMTAQLYPLLPDEEQRARLELRIDGKWKEVQSAAVVQPGWSAHFRLEDWGNRLNVDYRVRHGHYAVFDGTIRKDPAEKDEIVVASLSCNAKFDRGDRDNFVRNLKHHDPDLLFFAGDQSYDHNQHTAAWLMFGEQFKEVLRDRPVVTIPDDHDVGHANLWGAGGKVPEDGAPSGGYVMPTEYVKMVERCQTWHLPDPYDPRPVDRGISVYFTSLNVGGVDFAILEDRKFKSGPKGKIPNSNPRPDHIVDSYFDPSEIDLPELVLLGERQLDFLNDWGQDWTDTAMKCVLSQTNFAGAVHLHGYHRNRLHADLDCNGWPQSGRNEALRVIRRSLACHLAGDQHLAVVTQHGIDDFRDGPFTFVSPAIVNEIYGRWWWPLDEEPGENPIPGSPLPWTGDYLDGLGNRITMHAYANPDSDNLYRRDDNDIVPPENPGDGYSIARFFKAEQRTVFECLPRKANATRGDAEQYSGWPIEIRMEENDGRVPVAYLPELRFAKGKRPVVQVIDESSGEILYTRRMNEKTFRPHVYGKGAYTVKIGDSRPDAVAFEGLKSAKNNRRKIDVSY